MNSERSWSTRRYQPGDEHDLLALFNRIFGRQRSLEHWQWQFARNPYAPPTIIVARRRSDGLLAGSHVVMPIALLAGGEKVLAAHTLDLVVHEDFRRQGLFETTARECFAWCLERGMRAVISFPNDQSYPGFVRTLGWSRILDPTRWDLRIGCSRALGASLIRRRLAALPDGVWRTVGRLRLAAPGAWSERLTNTVPPEVDALWTECARELQVSLWKDREYLAWRYDANPDHRFEHIGLWTGERLRALAVVHADRERIMICDWLAPRTEGPALARALVAAVCRDALARGADRVSFLGADDGRFSGAFRDFRSRPAPESVLTGRGLEDGRLDELVRDGSNWCLTYGDADYV